MANRVRNSNWMTNSAPKKAVPQVLPGKRLAQVTALLTLGPPKMLMSQVPNSGMPSQSA